MQKWNSMGSIGRVALLVAALAALPGASLAAGSGTVLSAGTATHAASGQPLSAGEKLAAGEEIVTQSAGGAAVAWGDLWLEIGPDTALRLDSDGSVSVLRGLVRAVDLSEAGAQATVHTPRATLAIVSGDTEILVERERDELCDHRRELRVARKAMPEDWRRIPPGQCAVVTGETIETHPAGTPRLALGGAQIDVAVASHFSPTDVAAPAPNLDIFPLDPDKRTYLPCDSPGSCGGAVQVQVQRAPRVVRPRRRPAPKPSFGFETGPADQPGRNLE